MLTFNKHRTFLYYTLFNDQTANWLLFSGVLVAAFCSRFAKISRRPSARVPHGQGGMAPGPCPAAGTPTKASGSSHHSENRFPHPRSNTFCEGEQKTAALHLLVTQDGSLHVCSSSLPPFSISLPPDRPLILNYHSPLALVLPSLRCYYLGSRLLLLTFGLASDCHRRRPLRLTTRHASSPTTNTKPSLLLVLR